MDYQSCQSATSDRFELARRAADKGGIHVQEIITQMKGTSPKSRVQRGSTCHQEVFWEMVLIPILQYLPLAVHANTEGRHCSRIITTPYDACHLKSQQHLLDFITFYHPDLAMQPGFLTSGRYESLIRRVLFADRISSKLNDQWCQTAALRSLKVLKSSCTSPLFYDFPVMSRPRQIAARIYFFAANVPLLSPPRKSLILERFSPAD